MSRSDSAFAGSIPELYETHLVPLIFVAPAADLAARAAVGAPRSVLETAAGTGVVARALAPRLAPGARYLASDLNQPMLDAAARRQPAAPPVEWRRADALALPFEAAAFDLALCQFGVMFFPDRRAGFREAARVLRPGGRFLFSVWDRIETNGFAEMVTAAAAEVFPHDPPRFLARTPHGHHDLEKIRADLAVAGFSRVQTTTLDGVSRAPDPSHPAVAYVEGTPLRNEIEARDPARLGEVTRRAAAFIAERCGTGPVEAPIRWSVIEAEV